MKKIISTISIFLFSITFVGEVFAGPKLTMLINQSPWFDGFRKTLEMYEEETGASIELDVNPYPAMSEKIRNSIRAPEGIYDIVITSTEFMSTYSDSGEFRNINDIDPNYKLDPWICSYQNTSYWNYDTQSYDPVNGEFIGGSDILISMYNSGELKEKLEIALAS